MNEVQFRIVHLEDHHDREAFECGHEGLNSYLRERAFQDEKAFAASVYVATPIDAPKRIAGYVTVSMAGVDLADIPETSRKAFRKYPQVWPRH